MVFLYATILKGIAASSGDEFRHNVGPLDYDAPLAPWIVVTFKVGDKESQTTTGLVERVDVRASRP